MIRIRDGCSWHEGCRRGRVMSSGWAATGLGIAVRENHYVEEATISTWIMVNRSHRAWDSWFNHSQVGWMEG